MAGKNTEGSKSFSGPRSPVFFLFYLFIRIILDDDASTYARIHAACKLSCFVFEREKKKIPRLTPMKNLFRRILSVINNGDEFGEKEGEGLRKRKTGKRSQWQQQGEREKKKEGKLRVHSYFTIREIKKQKPSIGRGGGEARTFFCNRSVNNKNAVARGGSHSSPLCASRFKKKKKRKDPPNLLSNSNETYNILLDV